MAAVTNSSMLLDLGFMNKRIVVDLIGVGWMGSMDQVEVLVELYIYSGGVAEGGPAD
jgi:hypothetical protein